MIDALLNEPPKPRTPTKTQFLEGKHQKQVAVFVGRLESKMFPLDSVCLPIDTWTQDWSSANQGRGMCRIVQSEIRDDRDNPYKMKTTHTKHR